MARHPSTIEVRMNPRLSVVVGVLAVGLSSAASAATHVVVRPRVPPPDNVTQPALVDFMREIRSPTIVLRVPAPQTLVTQTQGQQGNADLSQAYLAIEKELVRSGFTVRDRGLLQEILRSNQNLDYRGIQQKIDAQLILEIVQIAPRDYDTDTYVEVKSHREGRLRKGTFAISGWHFESRVIIVNTGEIGGIYTLDVVPQGMHSLVAGNRVSNATPQGRRDTVHMGYGIEVTQSAPAFVSLLVSSLKPGTRPILGVRVAPIGPEVARQYGFKIPKKAKGTIVVAIDANSRADAAGVRLGDIIEAIDGAPVHVPEDVVAAADRAGAQAMTLTINRGGKPVTIPVAPR
jgi:hypothetical protein